jgi:hypothetical protein
MQKVLAAILFSNSFYGITAVALAIESNRVLKIPLNHWIFYVLLFCGTVGFYLLSYRYDPHPLKGNQRATWISTHKKQLTAFQYFLFCTIIAGGLYYWVLLPPVPLPQLLRFGLLLSVSPVLGFLYNGVSFPGIFKLKLRLFGWFKPFIIGAVWAGCVSLTPWVLYHWEHSLKLQPNLPFLFFGLHNWMFISVLAILFDIKDYAADHNQSLKTFVVRKGLRQVIFTIVLPLSLFGISALSIFLALRENNLMANSLFLLPMGCLCWVSLSLGKRRSVSWYLLIIDGLMLVKAICGIAAMAIG